MTKAKQREKRIINADNRVVPISKVRPNAWNPKLAYDTNDEGKKQFARIKKSLARHGQVDPILVRQAGRFFEIVNGYHRYRAALELGWKEIEVKNLGMVPDAYAKALAIATEDSHVALDQIAVAKLVKEILELDPQALEDLSYDEEDAAALQKLLDFDWDKMQKEAEGDELDDGDDLEEYMIELPPDLIPRWKQMRQERGMSDEQLITALVTGEND